MENLRSVLGNGEDSIGIPEDLRCKRSDGKQWRCTAKSMPDKTVCEKHYVQAKRRAANSALRASMRKAQKKVAGDDSEMFVDNHDDDIEAPLSSNTRDEDVTPSKKNWESTSKDQHGYSSETSVRVSREDDDEDIMYDHENDDNTGPPRNFSNPSLDSGTNGAEYSDDGTIESSEDMDAQPCHQCRKKIKNGVVWCQQCDRRGYCINCISSRYSGLSREEIEKVCPACRGVCFCRSCIRTDNTVKVLLKEIPFIEKLQYLCCVLSAVLPVIKRIHHVQCTELELEKKLRENNIELLRTKLHADEQMCCNICRIPIIDYHRHCTNCSYDVCLQCCQDLRAISQFNESQVGEAIDESVSRKQTGSFSSTKIDLSVKYPLWKVNSNGSIPCPPKDHGGCGRLSLSLCRIFKMNWVAKLVKATDEMVSGCKLNNMGVSENVDGCKECGNGHFLYSPSFEDIKAEGIVKFRSHWARSEPVIVTDVFNSLAMSSWDPMVLWKEIQEISLEKAKQDSKVVKAIDCLNGSEVDIELSQFIRGYSEEHLREDGEVKMWKLKDWPSPASSEEFLLYRRPEFFSRLPLLEYIHSKLGVLNVAAKLPHYSLQNDAGPKIYLSYGTCNELGRGECVTNLSLKMRDMVYLLMHTKEVARKECHDIYSAAVGPSEGDANEVSRGSEIIQNNVKSMDGDDETMQENSMDYCAELHDSAPIDGKSVCCRSSKEIDSKMDRLSDSSRSMPGIYWDVFNRKDVPKLIEYLQKLPIKSKNSGLLSNDPSQTSNLLFDGVLYLDSKQKKHLKNEFGIEPWSFEQNLGQAVFIPAGCPFQARNLQSTVQLGLDFLSPESFLHAATLADEIRCLPNDSEAKLQVLEVGKISLYAASLAIKEVQKLVLDPKISEEIDFEDPNLTSPVSDHLQIFANRLESAV